MLKTALFRPESLARINTARCVQRLLLRLLTVFGISLAFAGFCHAEWPEKPIKWIVPAAASGASDAAVRIVADQLSRRLGAPVFIENKPGASGAIGLDAIAKALPDGYTIGTANITNIVLNRQIRPKLPFNPDRDFIPIARLTSQPNVLVVNSSLPVKNVKELIAYAKARPKAVFYGSSGSGSSMHIAGEFFNQSVGIELIHIPYKSSPLANTDLAGNNIQVMIDNQSTLLPHIQSGKIRALAVTAPRRSPLLPNVPTMAESGAADFQMLVWGGVIAPRGVPPAIAKRLSDELLAILKLPEVRARFAELGSDPDGMDAAAFGEFIRQENQRWGAVVRKANIKPD
jgi:tripartite-type tricarboxylate transporter receptor subunit TctC